MRVSITKSLQPGVHGTKKLVEKYGDKLVCVRFRVDREAGMRYKTVELIEESRVLQVSPQPQASATSQSKERGDERMFWFRFRGFLPDLFQVVMRAGGRRGKESGVWGLPWKEAEARGLLECEDLQKV